MGKASPRDGDVLGMCPPAGLLPPADSLGFRGDELMNLSRFNVRAIPGWTLDCPSNVCPINPRRGIFAAV